MILRPYQARAVNELGAGFKARWRRQVLVAPTGSGKTVVAGEMMIRATEKGTSSLFLAPRRELIFQARDRLTDLGLEPGVLMAGEPVERSRPIQVCSIETVRRRPWVPDASFVVVDECHLRSFKGVMERFDQPWVAGLTATPWRMNGQGLVEDFDRLVLAANYGELIDEGHILEPRVYAPSSPDLESVSIRGGEFDPRQVERIMRRKKLTGDIVSHWMQHARDRLTVVFASSVAHSQELVQAFSSAGIEAEHLDGSTPYGQRRACLQRLARGETRIVGCCDLLTYGWDCPPVSCAVVARPTASLVMHMQMCGRILRPCEGKDGAVVLDHAGNSLDHGLPTEDRFYDLGQPRARRSKGARNAAPLRTCEECFALSPAHLKACEACGVVFRIKPRSTGGTGTGGELREFSGSLAQRLRWSINQLLAEKAEYLVQQQRLAAVKGYKPGWALHRFKLRYGHWPTREVKELAGRKTRVGDPGGDPQAHRCS